MTAVRLLRHAHVGRIILVRPRADDAVGRSTADAVFAALAQFESDPQCRVVHLGADGEDFTTGGDPLTALGRIDAGADEHRADAESLGRVLLAIRSLMKPVVCTLRGRAIGVSAALALACDVVLAHESVEIGFPEVRHGAVAALLIPLLRRSVGERHAADLLLTGRILNADDAERIGLVSRVVPAATYEDEVDSTLAQIGAAPSTALALTKWLLYKSDALGFEDAVAAAVVTTVESMGTDDYRAGAQRRASPGEIA